MPTEEEIEKHKKQLAESIAFTSEQLAMLQYGNKIKGCLVLVIDDNNIFRLMEAYDNSTALAMNAAIDIAKDNVISTMKRTLTNAENE